MNFNAGDVFRWANGTVFRATFIKGDEISGQIMWPGCSEWAPYAIHHSPRSLQDAVRIAAPLPR